MTILLTCSVVQGGRLHALVERDYSVPTGNHCIAIWQHHLTCLCFITTGFQYVGFSIVANHSVLGGRGLPNKEGDGFLVVQPGI